MDRKKQAGSPALTRRGFIGSAAAAGAAASGLLPFARAWAQSSPFRPEDGARLTMMRLNPFITSEGVALRANVEAFSEATGVPIKLQEEWIDDVQPRSVVAANTGVGPDLVFGLNAHGQQFPDSCLDITDVADYLGGKYGGWMPLSEAYGRNGGRWIQIPLCVNGNYINYRISHIEKAGFGEVPGDTDGFLELVKALKASGNPAGFALGRASGDGNAWMHWALWSHGARVLDEGNNVVLDSPEAVAACDYVKLLHASFVNGTESWLDGHNNKAFLGGQVSMTNNGISIYAAAQREPQYADIAADMDHAYYPIGPIGRPTELHIAYPILAFGFTEYPNACKALIAFLLERENYSTWSSESKGYLTHTLQGYDDLPVWEEDPKRRVFRDATARSLPFSHAGAVSVEASGILSDFVVVDMFGQVVTGQLSSADAVKEAARRAKRIFR